MIYAKADPVSKTIIEYPVDPRKVRDWANANGVPISDDLINDDLTPWGWYAVDYVPPPRLTTPNHNVVLDTPVWDGQKFLRTFKEVPRAEGETEDLWAKARQRRDILLSNSDWIELPSVAAKQEPSLLEQWQIYRQALRDITNAADPQMINWPVPPVDNG